MNQISPAGQNEVRYQGPPPGITAQHLLAANTNRFGGRDTGTLAQEINVLRGSDPAAAAALFDQVKGELNATDKAKLQDVVYGDTLGSTQRIGAEAKIVREGFNDSVTEGKVEVTPSLSKDSAKVEGFAGWTRSILNVGGGVSVDTNFGRGTVGDGNANANPLTRFGNAAGRAFDATAGRVFNGLDFGAGMGGEVTGNLRVGGSAEIGKGKSGVPEAKGGAVAGAYFDAKTEMKAGLTVELPFANVEGSAGFDGFGGRIGAGGAVGEEGTMFVPGLFGKVDTVKVPKKDTVKTEVAAKLADNWEGSRGPLSGMNAAGAAANTAAAGQVQDKFAVSRSGMLTMNLDGRVGFFEGVSKGQDYGAVTASGDGTVGKLAGEASRLDKLLGGSYTTVEDAARFMNEIGRQNEGGGFGSLTQVTPEQLAALNEDKLITATVGGQEVQLISNENIRTPYFVGEGGAEFRTLTEGASGEVNLDAI